jgi:hypothetical protein
LGLLWRGWAKPTIDRRKETRGVPDQRRTALLSLAGEALAILVLHLQIPLT